MNPYQHCIQALKAHATDRDLAWVEPTQHPTHLEWRDTNGKRKALLQIGYRRNGWNAKLLTKDETGAIRKTQLTGYKSPEQYAAIYMLWMRHCRNYIRFS